MRRLQILPLTMVALMLSLALCAASASAAAPVVLETSFSSVGTSTATLKGVVDPEERVTSYHFEYGLADCTANPCTATPSKTIPKGDAPVAIEEAIEGLTAGTTYHFRLLASNADGKDESTDRVFTTHQLPQVFGACPNDSLRTEQNPMAKFIEYLGVNLPDCRAYEQASPVEKNGGDARGMVASTRASLDGKSISFSSATGIPGGEGAQKLPISLASRGEEGWSTQGLLPPASAGQDALVRGWSPDFSQVFDWARRLEPGEETAAFLSLSTEDRTLAEIVSYEEELTDTPDFAGSSPDGSVVVFDSNSELTDEAVAGASNVYVWERATGELRLVSVLNDGSAPAKGAFAGAYNWIRSATPSLPGDKEVAEGGSGARHYTQEQRVVSTDGKDVYFTAASSGELYLRRNATEPQSPLSAGECTDAAKACTVQVSASQRTTPDPAGPRPAAFMAASADGSVAYFTSPEKLTDDATTGPEQDPPSIARAEIDGSPVELDFLPQTAQGIAVQGNHIYWADPTLDAIGRAKLNGTGQESEVEAEFIEDLDNPRWVAVDAEHVYWTSPGELNTEGKPQDGNGTIGRAKLGLSGPEEIDEDFITGAHNPQGVAVNATHVFWSNAGSKLETRTIGRAELSATEAKDVKQAFIQVDEPTLELIPQGIALNAEHIYVSLDGSGDTSFIVRYDLDGDPESEIFTGGGPHPGIPGVRGITLDASFVYWARQGMSMIGRAKLDLTSPEREFIKDAGHPFGLALDTEHLYWSANQEVAPNPGNDLYRFEADSGELTDLTVDASAKNGAEVKGVLGASADGAAVYFAANGDLAPGADPGNCKGSLVSNTVSFTGQCNLYLAREGEPTAFVARLDAGGGDAFNWLPGAPGSNDAQKTARVSADGNTLLFRSAQQLDDYDNEDVPQLYRYDALGKEIDCVSCNFSGEAPVRTPKLASIALFFLFPNAPAATLSRNLSADGQRVFFETSDALLPGDTNGQAGCPEEGTGTFTFPICQDVYEWEANGAGSCESTSYNGGCLYLLSTGESPNASFFADASLSGDDAFIATSSKLVGQDQDQLYDIYDARVNGGLASQNEPIVRCPSLDDCRPAPPTPPVTETPASTDTSGTGNVSPAKPKRRCPKGKRKARVKGKVRCVPKGSKRQRGKGKARQRAAKTTGRASR